MKAVVVGAGHNGLVAACYLAKAGFQVTLLEAQTEIGGLSRTEEIFPGVRGSMFATWLGLLRPEIIRDLDLEAAGLERVYMRIPEVALFPEGNCLHENQGADMALHAREPLRSTERLGWKVFFNSLREITAALDPMLMQAGAREAQFEQALQRLGCGISAADFHSRSLIDVSQRFFGDTQLLRLVASSTFGHAQRIGSLAGAVYKTCTSSSPLKGSWGFARGGMGSVGAALARRAACLGVTVLTGKCVREFEFFAGKIRRTICEDGSTFETDALLWCADPQVARAVLPASGYQSQVSALAQDSPARIHLLLSELPRFPAAQSTLDGLRTTFTILPSWETFTEARAKLDQGAMPSEFVMSLIFPGQIDPSLLSHKQHLCSITVQYTPPIGSKIWEQDGEQQLLQTVLRQLERHAPGISNAVTNARILSARAVADRAGAAQASCWHLPYTAKTWFEKRAFTFRSGPEQELANAFLCGAGAHPGPTVCGAPGFIGAQRAIQALDSEYLAGLRRTDPASLNQFSI